MNKYLIIGRKNKGNIESTYILATSDKAAEMISTAIYTEVHNIVPQEQPQVV